MAYGSATSFLVRRWSVVRLVLFALVIASFAKSLFDFNHAIKSTATQPPSSVSDMADASPLADIQTIARLGWFGIVPESTPPSSNVSSQFELRGISASGKAQLVGAFIAEQGKPENYYRVGDTLPNGDKLDAVFSDHVTIRKGQALTVLGFAGTSAATQPTITYQPPIVYGINPAK